MTRILPLVLLTGLSGCLGAPDRYTASVGYGAGDFTRDGVPTPWESEELYGEVGLEGPIGWGGTPVPREWKEAKADLLREIDKLEDEVRDAEGHTEAGPEKPIPWEQIMAGLMVLAGGGAIGHEQYRQHKKRKENGESV